MKIKLLIIILTLSSCTKYIIDPRGSKYPKEIVRDKIECKQLVKENVNAVVRLVDGNIYLRTCLTNRGHSILN